MGMRVHMRMRRGGSPPRSWAGAPCGKAAFALAVLYSSSPMSGGRITVAARTHRMWVVSHLEGVLIPYRNLVRQRMHCLVQTGPSSATTIGTEDMVENRLIIDMPGRP